MEKGTQQLLAVGVYNLGQVQVLLFVSVQMQTTHHQ